MAQKEKEVSKTRHNFFCSLWHMHARFIVAASVPSLFGCGRTEVTRRATDYQPVGLPLHTTPLHTREGMIKEVAPDRKKESCGVLSPPVGYVGTSTWTISNPAAHECSVATGAHSHDGWSA